MPINSQLTDQLSVVLADQPNKDALIQALADAHMADDDDVTPATEQAIVDAWAAIVPLLLKSYRAARDDIAGFPKLAKDIQSFEPVATTCVNELSGRIDNNRPLAADLMQLLFRVYQYYSLTNQFEESAKRYEMIATYMEAEKLQKDPNAAVLYNLNGGEASRNFFVQVRDPKSDPAVVLQLAQKAVNEFTRAIELHQSIGSTLETTPHMRHVQMCLASVVMDELLLNVARTKNITETAVTATDEVVALLDNLEPHVIDDKYRTAGILRVRAKVEMMDGNIASAVKFMEQACLVMPGDQYGQAAQMYQDAGELQVMIAALNLMKASSLTRGKAEPMYGDAAAMLLASFEQAYCVKLAIGLKVHHDRHSGPDDFIKNAMHASLTETFVVGDDEELENETETETDQISSVVATSTAPAATSSQISSDEDDEDEEEDEKLSKSEESEVESSSDHDEKLSKSDGSEVESSSDHDAEEGDDIEDVDVQQTTQNSPAPVLLSTAAINATSGNTTLTALQEEDDLEEDDDAKSVHSLQLGA